MQAFLHNYPEVRIVMAERLSHETLAAVATGQADIGIVTWDGEHPELEFLPYRQNELVAVVPETDSLTLGESASFADCLERPFVCLQSSSAIYTFIANKAAALGRHIDIRIQVASFASMLSLIRAGVGIGLMPRPVLQLLNCEGVRILPLRDDWAVRPLRICKRRDDQHMSRYAQALLACLDAARLIAFNPMKTVGLLPPAA
jgi:DNA-binding transcriptional LysR family regulator